MSNNSSTNPDSGSSTPIIWLVVFITVGLLVVVFNLATILTFVMNRHLRRRSVYCLINLAVADMMYGGFSIAFWLVYHGYYSGFPITVKLNTVVQITNAFSYFLLNSFFSLVVVSLERVYATLFPFRHRATRFRTYFVVFAITGLLPVVFVLLEALNPFFNMEHVSAVYVLISSVYFSSLVIICVSYTAIFIKVKNQAQRLQLNQPQSATQRATQKRERHLAMTLFIVTVLSVVTWLPWSVTIILYWVNEHSLRFANANVLSVIQLLQTTNSLINPIIYVFRMRDFRKALSRLLFKCSRDQQHLQPIGNHGGARVNEPAIELAVIGKL